MFTKYTQVQYDQATYDQIFALGVELPYVSDCVTKAQTMKDEGKTPYVYASEGILPRSFKRLWIDTSAADEWMTFQIERAATYGYIITNYEIGDNA